jgi:prepilin-type N-terminal cleavage/methylation domain-containing protein
MKDERGFTLIELLVVLAIVAILSVVVILTLNPTELLKQARDSNRLSDLGTLKSAISLYLADVSPPFIGTSTNCYISTPSTVTSTNPTHCGVFSATGQTSAYVTSTVANNRNVNNTGWIPINFGAISSGVPLGNLPVDPLNTNTYFYAYAATTTNNGFEATAILESIKYIPLMSTDGGSTSTAYEVGTNLFL